MSALSLVRDVLADLEVRADGRTIFGLVVPYGVAAEVSDQDGHYRELFRQGSFAKTVAERATRTKLLVQHDRAGRLPIGRSTLLREDTAGLYGEFLVSQTAAGEEVLALVRDGALDGFSIGFRPINHREHAAVRGGLRLVERTEAALTEVSVVSFPAYQGASIQGVRSSVPSIPSDEARRRLAIAKLR